MNYFSSVLVFLLSSSLASQAIASAVNLECTDQEGAYYLELTTARVDSTEVLTGVFSQVSFEGLEAVPVQKAELQAAATPEQIKTLVSFIDSSVLSSSVQNVALVGNAGAENSFLGTVSFEKTVDPSKPIGENIFVKAELTQTAPAEKAGSVVLDCYRF